MSPRVFVLLVFALGCVDGGPADGDEADARPADADTGPMGGGAGGAGGVGSTTELDGAADPDAAQGSGADAAILEDAGGDLDGPVDVGVGVDAGEPPADALPCVFALGSPGCPILVDEFPFVDARDTRNAPASEIDSYACAPDLDESGGEFYYQVVVAARGVLQVAVDDMNGDDVDIDVHLLSALDPDTCLDRANFSIAAPVEPGTYFVVADTWVNGDGVALGGRYELSFDFRPPIGVGDCEMAPTDVRMFWRGCAAGIDCYERDGQVYLRTPSSGPVVKEAHLVTVADDFGGGWPDSFWEGIERHYQLSQDATGYVAERHEPWAPAGEGGSEYGQAAYGRPLPVVDEAWYVNMYWRDRPEPGTRILVINPQNGRAVVAAGGYETGPGSNTAIGGAVDEIHIHLESDHGDEMIMGFALDQDLPLGPIDCR